MEKFPEDEPVPIQLNRPELELAWRGLLYSIEAGYLTRKDAIRTLKEWDGQEVEIPHDSSETAIIRVDE